MTLHGRQYYAMHRPSLEIGSARILAIVVLFLLFIPIVYASLHDSAGYDEAITLLEISGNAQPDWPREIAPAKTLKAELENVSSFAELITSLQATDVHPPLYYLAAWLLHAVSGPSLFLQRTLSTGAVLIGLAVLLRHLRELHPDHYRPRLAAFAGIFLTLPGLHFAATSAGGYGVAIALLCVAYAGTHALVAGAERPGRERRLAAAVGLACGAAFATNYLAFFMAAALWLAAFTALERRRRFRATLALAAGAAPLVMIAAAFLALQFDSRPAQAAGFVGVVELAVLLVGGLLMAVPNATVPYAPLASVAAVLAGLALVGAVSASRARRPGVLLPLSLVGIHILGLVALSWAFDKTLHEPRYLSLAGPFLALALAHGASWLPSLRPAL